MAWLIRSGREGEMRERVALLRGVAVINWDWLPDLTGLSPGEIRGVAAGSAALARTLLQASNLCQLRWGVGASA